MLLAGIFLLGSCGTLELLRNDVRSMDKDTRIIGNVATSRNARVKILVLKKNDEGFAVADSASPSGMGDFAFLLPATKSYYLAAVEDRNSRHQPDPDHRMSVYGGRVLKEIPAGRDAASENIVLKFALRMDRENSAALAVRQALAKWNPDPGGPSDSVPIGCGEIASLDDPAFDPEAGEKGLWAPITSAKRNGLGIYFLEPYDPAKIPVVFVHGIGGTPRSWRPIIRSLDHRRYQAWFYSYPSGLPIESAAKGFADLSDRLHRHYGFEKMHIVAHSMGGLVARRSVQMISNEGKGSYPSSLTTISTPWNGVPFAVVGTVGMSSPIPCWFDLRPNSKFIQKILGDPLPVPHLLISTEKSRFKLTLPGRNDGSVSVASQLDPRAVSKAKVSLVVYQDHTRVLEVDETKEALGGFLKTVR